MKRSEMIKMVVKKYNSTCSSYRHYLDESHINEILTLLEDAGMLPPMLPIPEYAFQADHAWEPEDESL